MHIDKALAYLNRDPLLYMDMIEPIRRGVAEVLAAGEYGVLLHETMSGAHMLAADTRELGEELLSMVPSGSLWVAHQKFMVDPMLARYRLTHVYECLQAVYLSAEKQKESGELLIRPLDVSYAGQIVAQYAHAGLAEIEGVLQRGNLFGGFLGEELAAFGGFHLEGSIGMLEVFPAYRRRGFARQLERYLMNLQLDRGRVPYAQIFMENDASVSLHRKLGFRLAAQPVYWLD